MFRLVFEVVCKIEVVVVNTVIRIVWDKSGAPRRLTKLTVAQRPSGVLEERRISQ